MRREFTYVFIALAVTYFAIAAYGRWGKPAQLPHEYDIVLGWHTFAATAYSLDQGELVFITTDGDKVMTPYSVDVRIVQLDAMK